MAVTFNAYTINHIESMSTSHQPHRAKQTLGKRAIMVNVIGADSNDNVLDLRCRLTASTAAALVTARNNIEDSNDGGHHAFADSSDTRYNGNYVIETGSLIWDRQINPFTIIFRVRLVEW